MTWNFCMPGRNGPNMVRSSDSGHDGIDISVNPEFMSYDFQVSVQRLTKC